MNERIPEGLARTPLHPNDKITLYPINSECHSKTFTIMSVLGCGGSTIAYKVSYEGADNNRYLYVLKELYPAPVKGRTVISRYEASLRIDEYDAAVSPKYRYCIFRKQFEDAYHVQNDMSTSDNAVTNITTSGPQGIFEDRSSSQRGNYAVYGLFQYNIGKTLKEYEESSLTELIRILIKVAEVVKAYHEQGYLWLDIKETNINVVGAGAVLNVSMFDFGSLISMNKLLCYNSDHEADFVLSFSPSSKDLLLPEELEILLSDSTADFSFVDEKKNQIYINALGESGIQTDIFLLGSMLYKRLMGTAPTVEDCKQLIDGTFDMARFERLAEYSTEVKENVKRILIHTLNYHKCNKRYKTVSMYLTDLEKLLTALRKKDAMTLLEQDARAYVAYCCESYRTEILESELTGKFRRLKALRGKRFQSKVMVRSDSSGELILPSVAIDGTQKAGEKAGNNRLVFLYGDGGMGKSTALYDYLCRESPFTLIYIELSQYQQLKNKDSFILHFIFTKICERFTDAVGYLAKEEIGRVESALLGSLTRLDPNNPHPQYILLLDGYNEISQEGRGYFDEEINDIISMWKNCRIVISGRTLPPNYDGKENPTYEQFSRFEFIGISEEERTSLIKSKYPERMEKIMKDERLWDVLRIPMFMGMFLHLNVDISETVHTRGEILDQFITKTEADVADQIAERQTNSVVPAAFRRFIVRFSLPYIANHMDNIQAFYIGEDRALELNDTAWSVFYNNTILRRRMCSPVPSKPDKANIFDEQTKHIIKNETGYFYITADGDLSFTHQYFRDYFAAKHIQNILNAAKTLGDKGLSNDEQLQFTKDNGLDYTWSDEVCILLGEIIGDYKNEPGYSEE